MTSYELGKLLGSSTIVALGFLAIVLAIRERARSKGARASSRSIVQLVLGMLFVASGMIGAVSRSPDGPDGWSRDAEAGFVDGCARSTGLGQEFCKCELLELKKVYGSRELVAHLTNGGPDRDATAVIRAAAQRCAAGKQ